VTSPVADQRAVTVVTSPRPIVDADNRGRRKASRSTPTHHAQQGVIAHLNVEPTRKRGRRSASERNREAVYDIVEPPGASGSWLDGLEPFSKDPPCAGLGIADEAAGPQNQRYPGPSGRKIRQAPLIVTMHAPTNGSAHRAAASHCYAPDRDHEAVAVPCRALNDKSARNKLRNVKSIHSSDPQPESEPSRRLDFIRFESEPKIDPLMSH
jgi:hypothetical protein